LSCRSFISWNPTVLPFMISGIPIPSMSMPFILACFDTGIGVTGSVPFSFDKSGDGVLLERASRREGIALCSGLKGEEGCVIALVKEDGGRDADEDGREVDVVVVILVDLLLLEIAETASEPVCDAEDVARCLWRRGLNRKPLARCSPAETEVAMLVVDGLLLGTTETEDDEGCVLGRRVFSLSAIFVGFLAALAVAALRGEVAERVYVFPTGDFE